MQPRAGLDLRGEAGRGFQTPWAIEALSCRWAGVQV